MCRPLSKIVVMLLLVGCWFSGAATRSEAQLFRGRLRQRLSYGNGQYYYTNQYQSGNAVSDGGYDAAVSGSAFTRRSRYQAVPSQQYYVQPYGGRSFTGYKAAVTGPSYTPAPAGPQPAVQPGSPANPDPKSYSGYKAATSGSTYQPQP